VDHLRHFGLADDPFRDEPRLRDFFESRPAAEALLRLERGLRQGRGLCVLSGEPGLGKSMLVRRLLDGLEEELFEASALVVLPGAGDAGAVLARFARHLGVEAPAAERQSLLAQIYEQLAIVREDGRQAVLLVDDAEQLARGSALAELCGLLRLEYEERRLLALVLAGAQPLDAALAADASLASRVDVRVRLAPLDAEDAAGYLAHRLRSAGGDPAIFAPDAHDAIHRLGRGLPGLMNRLADNALFEAFLCARSRVSRADVERAHQDLGFDVAPASAAASTADANASSPLAPRFSAPQPAPHVSEPESMPHAPFAGAGDELDSELEAIFEDAADAKPSRDGLRSLRRDRDDPLVARFLDD
jgi:general secretion pathway protein A